MRRRLQRVASVLAFTAAAGAWAAGPGDADLVAKGAYLANAGDCIACHTSPSGQPLAGGRFIDTPFGSISTPNITPDKATGIGSWSEAQFYRTMHDGIGHRGEYLYPVMPFPWYTIVTKDDVHAIYTYLQAQPAVHNERPKSRLSFPFSVRQSLLAWREVFFKPGEFKPDPSQTDEVNRGGYLVNGLAHCGECHNSRPVAGTSKWRESLQGGVIDNWYAPNITSDARSGIGAWSNQEIATYLKTGAAPGKGVALGPMAETVHSLSHLTDTDLLAIAAYLKTTPPTSDKESKLALYKGNGAPGGEAYLNYCASCHGIDGKGLPGIVPALDGNGAVVSKGPQNIVNVVLGGLPAKGAMAPMIAVGAGMSDSDIADVANYVRQAWSNQATPSAESGMAYQAREKTRTLLNGRQPCPAVTPASLARAVDADRQGVRTRLSRVTLDNMLVETEQTVAEARAAVPGLAQADLVNGLTAAYCKVVEADKTLDAAQRALRLGQFSQLTYSAAAGKSPSGVVAASRRAPQVQTR